MPPYSKDHSSKFSHLPLTTSGPQDCAISGTALLNTPYFNKGSAFPAQERVEFNLTGLLPHNVQTLEQQVHRAYQQYSEQQGDLAKNTFMTSMRDQNEVLFYRVCLLSLLSQHIGNHMIPDFRYAQSSPIILILVTKDEFCYHCLFRGHSAFYYTSPLQLSSIRDKSNSLQLIQDHIKEMYPIIYTPTEGAAIQNFSRTFRRPVGCFLNIDDTHRVYHDLAQWGEPDDIDYIVVTDGEEILGIGDQGVGGILISTAKLVLTTLCAGIHANRTLAVGLDCGTDNEKLRNNELYLGLKQARVRGEKYDKFVEAFVQSARKLYPKAYIHFEDFGLPNG